MLKMSSNLNNQDIAKMLLIFDKRISELEYKVVDIQTSVEELTKTNHPENEHSCKRSGHRKVEVIRNPENKNSKEENSFGLRYTKQSLLKIKEKTKIPKLDLINLRSTIQIVHSSDKSTKSLNMPHEVKESPRSVSDTIPITSNLSSLKNQMEELNNSLLPLKLHDQATEGTVQHDNLMPRDNSTPTVSVKQSYGLLIEEFDD